MPFFLFPVLWNKQRTRKITCGPFLRPVVRLLTVIKLWAGIVTGSLGIISEALHSGLDLMAAAMTFTP